MREKPYIYVAGPLFDPGERWYLETVDALCTESGYATYLPHRDGGLKSGPVKDLRVIFEADEKALARADLVVAVWNGPDVDSGTAWEIGYAFARGIPIIGLHEDIRIHTAHAQVNIVVYYSATSACSSIEELHTALAEFMRSWKEAA